VTAKELIEAFQIEVHQQDGPSIRDTDDVLHFLNRAQQNFILDKFAGSGSSILGFEQSQDLIDDLRVFYKKNCRIECIYGGNNAKLKDFEVDLAFLPGDYLHLVEPRADVYKASTFNPKGKRNTLDWDLGSATYDGNTYDKRVAASGEVYDTEIMPLRLTQSMSVYRELLDPFHKSTPNAPICDISEDVLSVYTDNTFIVDAVLFNYIRQPKKITLGNSPQTSELPESLHQEIVNRAVRLFLRYIPKSSQE